MTMNAELSRLELLKRANAARLKRKLVAKLLGRVAPVIAETCDSFTIAVDAETVAAIRSFAARFPQSGDWYVNGQVYGAPHESLTRSALAGLLEQHGLSGWAEFTLGVPYRHDLAVIGLPVEILPALIPALLALSEEPVTDLDEVPSLDDCRIVNRTAGWSLLLWHEGLIVFDKLAVPGPMAEG
jgi:hypothetical protein